MQYKGKEGSEWKMVSLLDNRIEDDSNLQEETLPQDHRDNLHCRLTNKDARPQRGWSCLFINHVLMHEQ